MFHQSHRYVAYWCILHSMSGPLFYAWDLDPLLRAQCLPTGDSDISVGEISAPSGWQFTFLWQTCFCWMGVRTEGAQSSECIIGLHHKNSSRLWQGVVYMIVHVGYDGIRLLYFSVLVWRERSCNCKASKLHHFVGFSGIPSGVQQWHLQTLVSIWKCEFLFGRMVVSVPVRIHLAPEQMEKTLENKMLEEPWEQATCS